MSWWQFYKQNAVALTFIALWTLFWLAMFGLTFVVWPIGGNP